MADDLIYLFNIIALITVIVIMQGFTYDTTIVEGKLNTILLYWSTANVLSLSSFRIS